MLLSKEKDIILTKPLRDYFWQKVSWFDVINIFRVLLRAVEK
jgi:hypothetical protein